jgi:hypothetical protein
MNKSSEEIISLPTAPINDFSRVGDIPAIYFFLDNAKRCCYVGKARALRKRLMKHPHNNPEKWKAIKEWGATQVAWWHCHQQSDYVLEKHENEWMKLLNPPLNYRLNNLDIKSPQFNSELSMEELPEKCLKLKALQKQIEEQSKRLRPDIISYVEKNRQYDQKQIITPLGSIRIGERPNWQYSLETENLKAELKERQKEEIKQGIAKVKTNTLYYAAYPKQSLYDQFSNPLG